MILRSVLLKVGSIYLTIKNIDTIECYVRRILLLRNVKVARKVLTYRFRMLVTENTKL